MKKLILVLLCFIISWNTYSQKKKILGSWEGFFKSNKLEIQVYFEFTANGDDLVCKMSVPDQFLKNIEASEVSFRNDTIKFKYPGFSASFEGNYNSKEDQIAGIWTQGSEVPIVLDRSEGFKEPERPQEPIPPFPYISEEVSFTNQKDDVKLAGTLTLPKTPGPYAAAILVSGSGPQNRNSELVDHKPFLVISDYLTRNGIAVLRYDDRGVGESTGNFSSAVTLDLADDAAAAVDYLNTREDIKKDAIGVIGHSEGGMIAPVVANLRSDVGFIILMAGPGEHIPDLMVTQNSNVFKDYGFNKEELAANEEFNYNVFNLVASDAPSEELYDTIKTLCRDYYTSLSDEFKPLFGATPEQHYLAFATQLFTPWFRGFLQFDAESYLVNVKCPVLAFNGSKDIQVPSERNLTAIANALKKGGNTDFTIKEFDNLNHLFQSCNKCTIGEYGRLEETFSPLVLELMKNWISERF